MNTVAVPPAEPGEERYCPSSEAADEMNDHCEHWWKPKGKCCWCGAVTS